MTRTSIRAALFIAASGTALAPIAAAAQQAAPAPARRTVQSWSLDLRTTYTDNYRRLPEDLPRNVVLAQPVFSPTRGLLFPQLLGRDTVAVDPPDNVVFSAGLRGGAVYERPGLTGVVSGGVTVSAYADDAAVDDRLIEPLTATPIPSDFLDGIPPGTELDVSFGLREDEEVFVQPDIVGSASVRVVEDLFFVDASALAQQQAFSRRADIEAESVGQLGDRSTYVGGSLSPYLTREVLRGGTVEARYRLSSVVVAEEEFRSNEAIFDADRADDRFGNDSLSQQVLLRYASGDLLDRLDVTLTADARRSEESGSDVLPEIDLDRASASAELGYDLNRTFGLTGTVGYDEITVEEREPDGTPFASDQARSDAFSGVFWSAGVVVTPSVRTQARLAVGERFGGTWVDGSLRYQPTPRLRVNAAARRELGTGVEGTFDAFRALNSQTLNVVEQLGQVQGDSARRLLDRAVGLRGALGRAGRAQGGLAVRNDYSVGVEFDTNRTTLSARASRNEAEFVGASGEERTSETANLTLAAQRQVSRRVTLTASARAIRTSGVFREDLALGASGATDQTSTQAFVSLDGAYRLGRRASATARVYHSRRDSEGERIAGTGFDYSENAASVGVRWTF